MFLPDEEIEALLRQSETFAAASPASLAALIAGFSERRVRDGESLVRQDERGEEMFLVVEGSCDVFVRPGKGGAEKKVGRVEKGGVFGEIAALTGGKRLASVRAAEDGVVLVIGHDDLQKALHKAPKLTEAICLSLARYMDN